MDCGLLMRGVVFMVFSLLRVIACLFGLRYDFSFALVCVVDSVASFRCR